MLLTKEEAAKAIDMSDFYRIPADNRDLNYGKYLEEGLPKITLSDEYNSNNTKILTVAEIKEILLKLPLLQEELQKALKYLVLGATGMAGHIISIYLFEQGHDVTTYSRTAFSYGRNRTGDITDPIFLRSLLLEDTYDVVVNCIGMLNNACEVNQKDSIHLNSYLPHAIVSLLENRQTKLIHLSTDCVFSGKASPYQENSLRDGETFYDCTKGLEEIENTKHLTLRNSIIGPDMKVDGIGLFNWFMKQHNMLNGYTSAIWTGVTTLTLAKALERAITEGITGIYHLVNNQSISKYDLLHLFNKHFKDNQVTILPCQHLNVDKTLVNTRNNFSFVVPSYEEMVIEMKHWIRAHKDLYPHYFK